MFISSDIKVCFSFLFKSIKHNKDERAAMTIEPMISVGYSRMDLGVHYPTDIIGSIVIAALSSLLCFIL